MPHSTAGLTPLGNIHHLALRCRDAEQTRWFYEDVLGLKMTAALSLEKSPGTDQDRPFLHLFMELGDGNYIAFFDEPGNAKPEHFELKDSYDIHIAFEVPSREAMMGWKDKIAAAGDFIFGPIDHDFVESVYFFDPNGYALEITCKTPAHDSVIAHEQSSAREQLAQWTEKTRAQKIALFGAQNVDSRTSGLKDPNSTANATEQEDS
jgi:catechol 2,3-dioxygenase-like lactoylglutathione lyase family enzyme